MYSLFRSSCASQGIPRVYIAVNSGARMGLATEVLKLFRVEWIDESQPSRGFKYLYVREKDYQTLMQTESIVAEPVQHPVEGKVSVLLASRALSRR